MADMTFIEVTTAWQEIDVTGASVLIKNEGDLHETVHVRLVDVQATPSAGDKGTKLYPRESILFESETRYCYVKTGTGTVDISKW